MGADGNVGGPWTRHGWPIDGLTPGGQARPLGVAKCGGPALCGMCALDAERIRRQAGAEQPAAPEAPAATVAAVRDRGLDAHEAAARHLAACHRAEEEGTPGPITADAFCGCETCEVREVIAKAWPHAIAAAADLVDGMTGPDPDCVRATVVARLRAEARRSTLLGHEVPA